MLKNRPRGTITRSAMTRFLPLGLGRDITGITLSRIFYLILSIWLMILSCSPSRSGGPLVGADQIFEEPYFTWIRDKRVGLITNQTGTNRELVYVADLLRDHPDVDLKMLFAPEHGIFGELQGGVEVGSDTTVFSLYGPNRAPTPEALSEIDVLVYDIQDVGVRFYTFISTMFESMKAAARASKPFLILDRPNPISGTRVEGPVLEARFRSFVGTHNIPIRYGMTPAELAQMLKEEAELDLVLWIVPLKQWNRSRYFDELNLHWIAPSPNMPTIETALLYPGTCLIEGTNLSEGRGTTRPFELIGAPWLKAGVLAGLLNNQKLPGITFRPQPFTPTFSKYEGQLCQGIQLHITDRELFRPILTTLYVLREVLNLHPDDFKFRDQTFDRLAGNGWLRRTLAESRTVDAIEDRWQAELDEFQTRREPHLLY